MSIPSNNNLNVDPPLSAAEITSSSGRKKLQLLPRTLPIMSSITPLSPPCSPNSPTRRNHRRLKTLSSKNGVDPFASAPTREEVLSRRGLDPAQVDMHVELRRQSQIFFTHEQQRQIDVLRDQVRALEAAFQEANENELPEDHLRQATDLKRKELQALMTRFRTENAPLGLLHTRRLSEPPDAVMAGF